MNTATAVRTTRHTTSETHLMVPEIFVFGKISINRTEATRAECLHVRWRDPMRRKGRMIIPDQPVTEERAILTVGAEQPSGLLELMMGVLGIRGFSPFTETLSRDIGEMLVARDLVPTFPELDHMLHVVRRKENEHLRERLDRQNIFAPVKTNDPDNPVVAVLISGSIENLRCITHFDLDFRCHWLAGTVVWVHDFTPKIWK